MQVLVKKNCLSRNKVLCVIKVFHDATQIERLRHKTTTRRRLTPPPLFTVNNKQTFGLGDKVCCQSTVSLITDISAQKDMIFAWFLFTPDSILLGLICSQPLFTGSSPYSGFRGRHLGVFRTSDVHFPFFVVCFVWSVICLHAWIM